MREVTERPEGVASGTVKIVGVNSETIISETTGLLENKALYEKMAHSKNPYGDGRASERIVGALLHHFGFTDRRPEEARIA